MEKFFRKVVPTEKKDPPSWKIVFLGVIRGIFFEF